MQFLRRKKRIYLDYAAATPVRKEVQKAMQPFWSEDFGNAGAIHTEGVRAHKAIESARAKLARVLHIRETDVYFTGSGTESNNIAILGAVAQKRKEGISYTDMEVISTKIEHPSVSETLAHVASLGVQVLFADVDEFGNIDANHFKSLLSKKTVLITFAYANSEIGTVQEVSRLARIVRAFEKAHDARIYVHTDAAQAPLWLPCALDQLSVDMISLDAGKCYGPKGVGILATRHGVTLAPHMFGGGQEKGLRSGTENTPLIVGAVEALTTAQKHWKERSEKIGQLRDVCIEKLLSIEGVVLNGSQENRIANNINVSIEGIDTEFAVISLDEEGIACATKSACGGADGQGSGVVRVISEDELRAKSTARFSLGEETSKDEIHKTIAVLTAHIEKTRKMQEKLTLS